MTALEVFQYDGAEVRTVVIDGEPWFVASDVARILGYRMASDMTRRLDDDEKGTHSTRTPGGDQEVTVVNEPGLYASILGSQVEGARAFKRWVTHDVLPAVRTTGQYVAPVSEIDQIRALHSAVGTLLAQREIDAPKVAAFDQFIDSTGLILIREAARIAGVGQNTAYKLLRAAGIIYRHSTEPTQSYAHRFQRVPTQHENSHGVMVTTWTTKVRPEHFDWLVGRLDKIKGIAA